MHTNTEDGFITLLNKVSAQLKLLQLQARMIHLHCQECSMGYLKHSVF